MIFLHRSQARKLVALIEKDPTHAYLPLTMKKMPTPESMAVEGGEIFATAVVELKDLLSPDSTIVALTAGLQGDQMENSQFTIKALLSSPLIPKSALDTLKDKPIHGNTEGSLRPADVISAKVVSVNDPNRDPLLDLREEISQTLERIAQEYLSLYPSNNNNSRRSSPNLADQIPPNAGKENESSAKEEKKVEFLNYLTTNGIFHELKENLKPKVQLVIKERYSNRGRALGKSDTMKQLDLQDSADLLSSSPGNKVSGEECVESVLNELYVFLLKECSIVLNSLFSDTVIDYNTSEVGKNALIDDEEETKLQLFNKLLQQATDCYADNRFYTAESCHLERIQLTNHIVSLGSDPAIVHDAYYQYANLLLSQAATTTLITAFSTNNDTNSFDSKINELKLKAREALAIAYGSKEGMWSTGLLYAAVLIESEQFDQAEAILDKVLLTQLSAAKVDYQLPSFVDFDGYESDKLCPVDPKVYGLLATYFSLQQQPIKARKALLMANR